MKLPVTIDPRYHDAVIFDLDGVVIDTASIHQAAWATLFDDYLPQRPEHGDEDHSPFTDDDYRRFAAMQQENCAVHKRQFMWIFLWLSQIENPAYG